jgi:hypothetical protein
MAGSEKYWMTGWVRRGIQTGIPAVAGALFGIALMSLRRPSSRRIAELAWKSYRFPGEGFKASFPSEPLLSGRTLTCSEGWFEMRMHMAKLHGALFSVNVCEHRTVGVNRSPEAVFEEATRASAFMAMCRQVSKSKVWLGIYPGVAAELENEGWHISDRTYHVGNAVYQMLVVRPINKPCAEGMRFFDSFQLIARLTL